MLIVGNFASNPAAESAISVLDANNYHALRGNDAWDVIDDDVKEQLLRKAGDYIKATYSSVWNPAVVALTTIPVSMAQANAELGLIAKSGPLAPNVSRGKKSVKIGPIQVEYDTAAPTQTQFIMASRLLAPLLSQVSGAMVPLIRC